MWIPDAFLFDMDGLLLDTERLFKLAFQDTTSAHGLARSCDGEFFLSLVGSSRTQTMTALDNRFGDQMPSETFRVHWEASLKTRYDKGVPAKPTVKETLRVAQTHNRPMAVVTSSDTDHARDSLERAGILEFFVLIKGGDAVSANKPDPAPYLEAAADLGVDPTKCAAFEDSDPGITAAMGAGCRAVQIPDLRPADRPFPDLGQHMASDLASALDLILRP